MFSLVRRLRPDVFPFTSNFKRNRAQLLLLHNLKIGSVVNAAKRGISAKTELALSNESIKKFIKIVIKEFETGRPGTSDFVSEQGYGEVSRLLKTRLTVAESIKTLEDLVEQDPEMKKLGEEEYSSYKDELDNLDEELLNTIFRNMGRENCNDIILEITTGVGGQESMLFAKVLFDMYLGYLDYLGFHHEIIHQDSTTGSGGIRHASVAVSGERALEILRHEGGVHRVQRIPATEKSGRVHTSTVSVAILPQPTDIEVRFNDKDLKIETKKSSGAGGQHVNTTDSAVRITHLPTGTSVECQTDRSQIRNRRIALLRLHTIIYEKQLNEQRETSVEMRRKQFGLGFRNEKIRTYNYNQDRVTDHRIDDGTMHNLKGFLEGGQVLQDLQNKLQRDARIKMFQDAVRKAIE